MRLAFIYFPLSSNSSSVTNLSKLFRKIKVRSTRILNEFVNDSINPFRTLNNAQTFLEILMRSVEESPSVSFLTPFALFLETSS